MDVKNTVLGWAPLHHACNEGNSEIWNLLLVYNADLFLRGDLMGWTPMQVLEQAMTFLHLESRETWIDGDSEGTWIDDEGNAFEEEGDDDKEWQDEVSENDEGKDTTSSLHPAAQEALARRRAKLRSRVAQFFMKNPCEGLRGQ